MIALTPDNLLKLDIVGAFVTCTVTGAVLATELIQTGMPPWILWTMSLAAGAFCGFGIFGYLTPNRRVLALRTLAILNLCFCAGSGIAWSLNFQSLTLFGRLYFPIEIVVVCVIAIIELSVSIARNQASSL